uniref:Uncharacterized protein n=1 Tax=Papaya meleira virus 2 TaxID=1824957 RepID=A0A172JTY7_9VIRU|nr:hypothetical protein [Papaya meleira virus 2]
MFVHRRERRRQSRWVPRTPEKSEGKRPVVESSSDDQTPLKYSGPPLVFRADEVLAKARAFLASEGSDSSGASTSGTKPEKKVEFQQTEILPDRVKYSVGETSVKSLYAERTAEEATRCNVHDLGWDIALPVKLPGGGADALTSMRKALSVRDTLASYPDFPGTVTEWVENSYLGDWKKRMEWEMFHWRFDEVLTPSAKMASRLRGHFGFRPQSKANALLGEHWLLEQYGFGLEACHAVRLAVKLWETPTIRDRAFSQLFPGFSDTSEKPF